MSHSARLASGAKLGPYEIVAPLGRGGMGEVYTATDTRLDRRVALKILPSDTAGSPEARQRFEREARAISKLSHPHVCALFDVGRDGDIDYLVMELLEGRTLAKQLAGGPMPWTDVVRISTEIADALAAAHAQGIVHRDLKPGNVMLTKTGVKLLDFGLAKPAHVGVPQADTESATVTMAAPLTEQGQLVGTAGYMSPEQLQGQPADARSDVFALGVILFEMAAGRRPFGGDTFISAASEILHAAPPPLSSLRTDVPQAFERLVHACLLKDPAARWQSAHDAAIELAAMSPEAAPRGLVSSPTVGRTMATGWTPWALAAVAIAAAAALWVTRPPASNPVQDTVSLDLIPPTHGQFSYSFEAVNFAVSPNGRDFAFVANDDSGTQQIWIRPLASLQAKALPGTIGASSVFWSPDGRSVGFFAGGFLKRLNLSSNAAVEIASVATGEGHTASWGADTIIFSPIEGGSLDSVPVGGGDVVSLATPDFAQGETGLLFPLFLPDGRRFLCVQRRADGTKVLMAGGPGIPLRPVMPIESNVQFLAPDVLVYAQSGTLVGRAFDLEALQPTGAAFSVADSVNFFLTTGVAAFSASPSGTLVYQAHRDVTRLAWIDRTGKEVGQIGTPGAYLSMRLNADGRRALFDRALPQTGTFDIWSLDVERNVEERLTLNDRTTEIAPVLLADAKTLFFSKAIGGAPRLARKNLGSPDEVVLAQGQQLQSPYDVSPDGRWLAYGERSLRGDYDIWLMPLQGDSAARAIQASPFYEGELRFSPDGRLYSFVSTETGRQELYIAATTDNVKTVVSSGGASTGRWSPDGRQLFYQSPDMRLISVPVLSPEPLRFGAPTTLFALGSRPWLDFAVSADGTKLLAAIPDIVAVEEPLTAMLGWRPPIR